jgi:hypothetical protein
MPMIDVYAAAGSLAGEHDLAQQLAVAVMCRGRVPVLCQYPAHSLTCCFTIDDNLTESRQPARRSVKMSAGLPVACPRRLPADGRAMVVPRERPLARVSCRWRQSSRFAP